MKLTTIDKISFVCIAILLVIAAVLYPSAPDQMPTHWNAQGEIDGYGSKVIGLFLLPSILLILYIFFLFIPQMTVHKENFSSFRTYFEKLKLLLTLFFSFFYLVTLLPVWGILFPIIYFIIPAVSILLYYSGYILQFTKRNHFIGIRTPWTLASDEVWEKTHKTGSITLRLTAIVFMIVLWYPELFIWVIAGVILVNVAFLYLYSYILYKR